MSFPAQNQHWSSLSWTWGPAAPALCLPSITSADKPALVPWCPARTSPVKHPTCQHKWQHETAWKLVLLWLLQVTATPHSRGGDIKQKYQQASIYRAGPLTSQSYWNHKSLYSHSDLCFLLPKSVSMPQWDWFLQSSPIPSLTSEGSSPETSPIPSLLPPKHTLD